jgi:hypothetical protein
MDDEAEDPHQAATSVRRGVDADLAFLHQKDATALSCAIANLEVLLGPVSVKLSVEEEGSEDEEADPSPTGNFDTSGFLLLVTKQAVLFWRINHSSDEDPNECDADLLIPGSCIDLQAITSSGGSDDDEPTVTTTTGVYLQVSFDDQGDTTNMLEINVQPEEAGRGSEICREIYSAVATLIELHPHAITEEDEFYHDDGPADNDDDEMVMASDFVMTSNTTTDITADEDNDVREQMLERLSNLLIVPPEYEIAEDDVPAATDDDDDDDNSVVEGQFADAEDDNDPFL